MNPIASNNTEANPDPRKSVRDWFNDPEQLYTRRSGKPREIVPGIPMTKGLARQAYAYDAFLFVFWLVVIMV